MTIGVLRHHIDGVADIRIAKRIGAASRANDVDPWSRCHW